MDHLFDALRLTIAAYLIAVAFAACVGRQRELLGYPWRAIYAAVRIILVTVTLGRLQITPLAHRAGRRNRRRLRTIRFELDELREDVAQRLGRAAPRENAGWGGGHDEE